MQNPEELIPRLFNGTAANDELSIIAEWMSESHRNVQELAELMRTAQLVSTLNHTTTHTANAYNHLQQRLGNTDQP